MTADTAPSVDDLGRSLARTTIALFLASVGLTLVLVAAAGRLSDALRLAHTREGVLAAVALAPEDVLTAVALTPLHLNLLLPLLAKRLLTERARQLLPAESVLVVSDDAATWRLFARATAVTVAALGASVWLAHASPWTLERLLASALMMALWFYRLVVVTVRWFRHARSLGDEVGILTRVGSAYRGSLQFFLDAVEGRREVVIERVDGARVEVKYVDAAQLVAALGGAAERPRTIEGVREIWRAAGPAGAKALARWFEGR